MSKIKVSELRELNKNIDSVIKVKYNGLNIEIKRYLPIQDKLNLSTSVYLSSLDDEELMLVNNNTKEIAKVYFITEYYTNISLPKCKNEETGEYTPDIILSYDLLMNTGLYELVANNIPNEIRKIEEMIDNIENYNENKYRKENDIKYMIKQLINKILTEKEMKKFIKEVNKEIKNFNPDKMRFIQDFLNKTSGAEDNGNKES